MSRREWQGTQPSQGATELGFPGPVLGKVPGEAARRAGEASGQGEEAPPEGLGGYHLLLTQTEARGPASQVGGEVARGEMVEADTVLQVADGILDLGLAAMVRLQFQGVPSRSVMKP